ncbi:MAG TPA: hypothetical protein VGS41_16355 [Chthonomonadales bacterium]|nr:hypothetical protein [Chthonomonadales bacterium]
MAAEINEGDRVQVVDREVTAADQKSGLFYNHFRGLTGAIQKIYPTDEVAVTIEADSLPELVLKRHLDVQEQMKSRWLDGLSEEAKGRLTEAELDFRLRYSILVKKDDLLPAPQDGHRALEADTSAPASSAPHDPPPQAKTRQLKQTAETARSTPPRRTLEQMEADEIAELNRHCGG